MDDKNKVKATINHLPAEVMFQFFESFNSETLKNSVLACKRWNELIIMNTKIMKKLPLRIRRSTLLGQYEFTRKYHTIQVEEEYPIDLANFLNTSELRVLKFHNFHLESYKAAAINNLFSSLDKLESFSTQSISLDSGFFKQLEPHHLPSLKEVNMSYSNSKLLMVIRSTPIASLTIEKPIGFDQIYLPQYLVEQTQLEILKLDNVCDSSFCYSSYRELIGFNKFIDLIFNKLHNLKTLVINAYCLTGKETYCHLQPNYSVQNIEISLSCHGNVNDFKAMFPNANSS